MRILIYIMILAGSLLMVYNIVRYGMFVKANSDLNQQSLKSGRLVVPLVLLVFFLVGYVVVGVSGIADLMMASILLGGSIFVFLLLAVMFSIISHIRNTDQVMSHRYEEMRAEFTAIARDYLSAFLVNLTRDEVEERRGDFLYDSDYATDSYEELLRARADNVMDASFPGAARSGFRREELLRLYQAGQTSASETIMVRRKDGIAGYVRFEAALSQMPVTGDVVAFIAERPCNEEVVRKALLEDVLMDEYDRIAYLINGDYRVIISNAGKKEGLLFPDDEDDTYESLYLNYILPNMALDGEKGAGPNPLRLSVVDKALAESKVYDVNAPFFLDGKKRYKHVVFYRIDAASKFYLMLVSDSTGLQEEQDIQNQRLSDALEEAVRARNARAGFFARVSQDLLTPVDGILGSARQASAAEELSAVRGGLEQIEASGRKLRTMLEDLFTMTAIDSGAVELEEKPTDLCALAEEAVALFGDARPEKRLSLRADTSGLRERMVLCDGQRLRKVLCRLLENSCAFAPEEGTVTLAVSQEAAIGEESREYEFSIRNAGVQIPPDVIGRIFEENAWDRSEKREELPGVGLGMAVAKSFVDAMGGDIRISSDEEGNADVSIRLPLRPLPADAAQEEAPSPAAETGEALHVLLVDDNELNREIGELMLTGEGWTVELAADGAEAVEKVSSAPSGTFDLILMDVNMPVMNGYEATAAIRALPDGAAASLPIIALTASTSEEGTDEVRAAGMDGFASKPIDPEAIRRELARIRAGE